VSVSSGVSSSGSSGVVSVVSGSSVSGSSAGSMSVVGGFSDVGLGGSVFVSSAHPSLAQAVC